MLRKDHKIRNDIKTRKHYLFKKASDKLFDELDCVTILKSVR